MARVLVVEDDEVSLRYTSVVLREEGHEVVATTTGEEALEAAARTRPDVILLDLGLPGIGGVETCRRLRARTSAPIIFLTGRRDDADKVVALDAGGDDYVVKPFSAPELAARIRAVLRRSHGLVESGPERLEACGVVLDGGARRVLVRGEEVGLTPREFDLLRLLMAHAGRVLDRQAIFDAVWGVDFVGDQSALDVYIRQLRRKIEPDPDHPELIQTVRGVGFRFVAADALG